MARRDEEYNAKIEEAAKQMPVHYKDSHAEVLSK